jgi:twitching motility protein PilT
MERKGSDLHLTAGAHPQIRVNGLLTPLEQFPRMMPAELRRIIYAILTAEQRQRLEENRELDASHPVPGQGRFRVNVFFQRDSVGAVLRAIPNEIQRPRDLGMPEIVDSFAKLHRGLVLVTGPTGSGKSTSLASIVNLINESRAVHIMTIEDPIEFLHKHKSAIVNQREVGTDTKGFNEALRHVLRQDPDVILVGEMRDLETISAALTAAETGHLVFGTLHTQSAPQSIDRVIDVFPSHQQSQVRVQLGSSIQAVVSQQLLPTADGKGRVVAVEVMIATAAIRNQIRDGKVHQIPSAMQAGSRFGMQTMDQSLADLVARGRITRELAFERCADPEGLKRLMAGG